MDLPNTVVIDRRAWEQAAPAGPSTSAAATHAAKAAAVAAARESSTLLTPLEDESAYNMGEGAEGEPHNPLAS